MSSSRQIDMIFDLLEQAQKSEKAPYYTPPQTGTPIHRLSPELLTGVFLHLRRVWEPIGTRGKKAPWLKLTQVCKRWKNIAYESATLWSHISGFYPPHIIEQWFRLSKSTPLTITNLCLSIDNVTVETKVKSAMSRVRRLGIFASIKNRNQLRSLLSSTAPILESLALSFTPNYATGDSQALDGLFSGIPPPLRQLSIKGCGLGSNSAFLTNLTILEIREPQPRFSAPNLLSILRELSLLTCLRMSNVLQCNHDHDEGWSFTPIPTETGVVELPSLEFLSIHGPCYAQDLDFLSHLSLPPTIILLFSSGFPYGYDHPVTAISDFLKVHASARQGSVDLAPTRVDLSP
ncbi:hypothetical protein BDN72DRAFT_68110 [Pluteus cervinus]|uniref:Uncharacterized protein n=1 Tax=Pluteus cervinus TaxID=181527 RepID=A0ACD3ASP7_9AGAR|nr:hypothetical protein BDN72DRAFT_68110 [Pluteus cervinus]